MLLRDVKVKRIRKSLFDAKGFRHGVGEQARDLGCIRRERLRAMLTIKFSKRRDGSIISRFERADGTATWQRKEGAQANFFAAHDLTHYALETTLGYRRGFYGLVAEGWDLSDFGTPWPRGPLPADAEPAELIAGLLDGERAAGERSSAAEFNEKIAMYYASQTAVSGRLTTSRNHSR